ncbi:LysR family transcriptional regulator [Aliivibrio fischeri]|uniref:LysR family transcriptional regulator n=3 Tax=Aliivibrio fischeri TaxID=668 RepID=A0A6I3YEG3_ALIFS|nr:LysR family transcriptional regulator [Aliivibrio fischeri]MUI64953.1 LysR family transcriptional regulator [Aliivibrio fischeri]MUJ25151.1 LysR family transcriptional regulator [Aliivibrio fischeri]MUJ29707.1 LysR family transcriptional regulator [Aliivibrio fischeri]MUJ39457.1 LysR family transcriptional regulator [Aliivibrio fischeri]
MGSIMLDNLHEMVIFATVANELNFTRAAEKLGISKSHVSKQVKALETRLDCQLVQRNNRSVSITELGSQYAEYCQKLIDIAYEADALLDAHHGRISGVFKVGIAQSFGNSHIIHALAEFQAQFPEIELEVSLFDHKPKLLEDGLDCWIAIHDDLPEGMVARKIADCRFVVAASPGYIEQHGCPTRPAELVKHKCITYQSNERRFNDWEFTRDGVHQVVNVQSNFKIDNASAILDATKAGAGIAYLASYLLENEFDNGSLVRLLKEWQADMKLPIYAVYPRRQHLPPKVRTFIDFLSQQVGNPPHWDKKLFN